MSNNKDWLNTNYRVLLSEFKNNFKIIQNEKSEKLDASLIMFPHEKKWIPKLSDFNYSNQDLRLNLINDTIVLNKILTVKKSFDIVYDKKDISIKNVMIDYYKLFPINISAWLKKWGEINFAKSNNKEDYLNKILNEFNTNNFLQFNTCNEWK